MTRRAWSRIVAGFVLVSLAGAQAGERVQLSARDLARIARHSPLPAPPDDPTNRFADDPAAARFGQFVFFDPGSSQNGELACATCHEPTRGFTDGLEVAQGLAEGTRNAPSLWNAAYQRWYFWDGRVDTLWAQALKPLESEIEMGSSRLAVAHRIHSKPELARAYEAIFGALPELGDADRFPPQGRPVPDDPRHPHALAWATLSSPDRESIDRVFANVGKALAAYERRLVSNDSAFDRFAAAVERGEESDELSKSAVRGLALFVGKANCRTCHAGSTFSDGAFHNIGIPPRGGGPARDAGRYGAIGRLQSDPFNAAGVLSDDRDGERARRVQALARVPESWGAFKTPSLRNVALTAPYMHQGQLKNLTDVVRFYSTLEGMLPAGHHAEQILTPLGLTDGEQADLVAFLQALTDAERNPSLMRAPPGPR